jgi:hypothetical protein
MGVGKLYPEGQKCNRSESGLLARYTNQLYQKEEENEESYRGSVGGILTKGTVNKQPKGPPGDVAP